jgi:hypothetical protein
VFENVRQGLVERLSESNGLVFGFKVIGKLTAEDMVDITQQIDFVLAGHKGHLGLLADLTAMEGASWSARWEEMRFLQRHTDRIARMAVISDDDWQEVAEMMLVATAALQAQTLYFHSSEMHHAWHWVKMKKMDEQMPVRVLYPGKGLFQDYTPEYMGI